MATFRRPDPLQEGIERARILSSGELLPLARSYVQIRRKAQAGMLVALGNGLYAAPGLDPFVGKVLATAKHYPDAVISGRTALVIHGLSDDFIERIDVDLPNPRKLSNRMLKVRRTLGRRRIGVVMLPFHGGRIRVYDRERALCEAYRLDSAGVGFYLALKRYVAQGRVDAPEIQKYDQALKTQVFTHLQQELTRISASEADRSECQRSKESEKGGNDAGLAHRSKMERVKRELCDILVRYRDRRDVTQKTMAEQLGIDRGDLSRILQGQTKDFSLERLMGYAERLGLGLDLRIVGS
jgi:predicted XRE-type DNA-binding protein